MPTLLAMPPPQYDRDLMVGLIVVIALMGLLIWQPTGSRRERTRRLRRLAWMAYVVGPLAGLGLALVVECLDPLSPRDLWNHLIKFGGIPSIVGFLVGIGFAMAAQSGANDVGKPEKKWADDLQ